MNYEQFRAVWHQALAEAGVLLGPFGPKETVDLRDMSRTYEVYAVVARSKQIEPFHVTAHLSWTWDALLSARAGTTEEDALMLFLGDERRHEDTERPDLRVDVTLSATLPWGSPLPLPAPDRWRDWLADVDERLELLLSTEWETRDEKTAFFASRSEPEAEVQPAADGQLYLTGVELAAWEGIELPRQWDDPDREQDQDPYEQLVDFAERVWEALEQWNQSLVHLVAGARAGQGR
ncbi:MAG TPA: hypothetical protein VLC52_04695 [Anaerolineae bacterium]|nr:hypothetical protein [Anaerolineae bacterium]